MSISLSFFQTELGTGQGFTNSQECHKNLQPPFTLRCTEVGSHPTEPKEEPITQVPLKQRNTGAKTPGILEPNLIDADGHILSLLWTTFPVPSSKHQGQSEEYLAIMRLTMDLTKPDKSV